MSADPSGSDVSVVIPYFNGGATIRRAVDSVTLALPGAERIVVDDGSEQPLEGLDAAIVVRQNNSGPGAARNLGVSHSTGRWIVFLDADDELCVDIARALPLLDDEVGIVSGSVSVRSGGTEQVAPPIALGGVGVFASLLAGSFIVSKTLFETCGGYDPKVRFGENTDVIIRCVQAAVDRSLAVRTSPEIFSTYHDQPDLDRRRYDDRRLESTEYLLDRGRIDLEDPRERARMHSIAAVAASRTRRYRRAISHAARAARLEPSFSTAMRLLATLTGPLARRRWVKLR